ncbi:hypothetical protein QYM36_002401 [Artemia franciscana]|uniref:t-SNARE coiled-coil homology domain-containing protein n=1 Tax=Artemia franciscana TaxID=6661 RepID=A0AA88I8Y2_ARTSF|nr:hypothetical protein QYM36_002401 [Artemia franciscana]
MGIYTDRTALIDQELDEVQINIPPEWYEEFEEVEYQISKVKNRLKELKDLQKQHFIRPLLDDTSEEDRQIQEVTREITRTLGKCYGGLNSVQSCLQQYSPGSVEFKLAKNVSSYLVNVLQSLSCDFKSLQSSYFMRLQSREDRTAKYFKEPQPILGQMKLFEGDIYEDIAVDTVSPMQQLLLLEEDVAFAEQRDREVANVAKSIQDMNVIFKEVAQMVSDQGTVLDRIDYNIENTTLSVGQGVVHLKKAETYQKSAWKKKWCLILFAILVVLMILIIAIET